ncbi:MAG: PrgI family protein [Candidatus Levybacteria bacterium]|nr:PrgI family protein [Candidatus Levybacteria bacterium]
MDNHPIPQDITGFQFKLIGSMTIKQFAYLATGVVIAWFIFFILPGFILIRLPLAILFLGLGASLAFLPVDGRPMDVMIGNLIRAVFAPTQYIYKRGDKNLATTETLKSPRETQAQPSSLKVSAQEVPVSQQSQTVQAQPQVQPLAQTSALPSQAPYGKVIEFSDSSVQPVLSGNLDDLVNERKKKDEEKILENEKKLEEEASSLKQQLDKAHEEEGKQTSTTNLGATHQKSEDLEKLLTQTLRQKEALEKQLLILQSRLEGTQQEKYAPTVSPAVKQTQRVKKVPAGSERAAGLPQAPQDPNIIVGIVKDSRGNPLPNILVDVKDPEENPVRAFKTNALGQFASATPLQNGKYIISFEDPTGAHKFDTIEIEAAGTPLMPLEIISIDAREELRRELFA